MYIALDGDFVGKKIENLILSEKLDDLSDFNRLVDETILSISNLIISHQGKVYLSGGDNILAFDPKWNDTIDYMKDFNQRSDDLQFSVGFANDIRLAYLALKFAKRSEKGKVVKMYIESNELQIDVQ